MVVITCLTFGICWAGWWIWGCWNHSIGSGPFMENGSVFWWLWTRNIWMGSKLGIS